MIEDWKNGGFGLYIHWPFCEAKCPYCDFNSHVSRQIDQKKWEAAYLSELDRYARLLPDRILNSIFFGGGTPSLMDPGVVANIIQRIRQHWPISNDLEITLEANPGSVEASRFRGFAEAGVNRISMGVQALNDHDLRSLGRIHTVAEARTAFDIARSQFDRVSFDLIYARQDQSLDDWKSELKAALNMAVDHLSLYQLTIEQGTAFGDRYDLGKLRGLPDDDIAADMFEATQDLCGTAGLTAYEVSNHARSGSESRHNLIYWRYGDYIGIGPGAHGRITIDGNRFATEAWSMPNRWLTGVSISEAEKPETQLSGREQAIEYLLLGLRIVEGIDQTRFARMAGAPLIQSTLEDLTDLNLLSVTDQRVATTPKGRMVLNSVVEALLPEKSESI